MDWRTVLLRYNWAVWYEKNLIIRDLFLNKNRCTYPTLTFQSIEVKSNRRTSVQTYFKICHFSLLYLRKFTFVPPVSKVFYLNWKRVRFTQNGRKNYFRTKEIEAKKVLMRNVNGTCAKNQHFFKITKTSFSDFNAQKLRKEKWKTMRFSALFSELN